MALTPYGPQTSAKYTLTGPDGTVATFNDSTDANFVGYLTDITGLDSPEVRENAENLAGQDGGVHGPFYYGRRPITMSGSIINIVSQEDRNKRLTKLAQASNAMRANAKLEWTPEGGEPVFVEVRRQQPLRVTGGWAKDFQLAVVSADPRIYSSTEVTGNVAFAPSEVLAAGGTKQMAGAASPDGKFLYIPNSTSANLTIYSRNTTTGTLTKVENVATGTTPYSIVISPDGKSLYCTNRGSNTISKFSRNEATGKLTTISAASATGSEPLKGAMTLDGKFLYVPNFGGSSISVFERNTTTGELTLKETNASYGAGLKPTALVCGERYSDSGYPMVIFVSFATSKAYSLRRNESTGALTIESGVAEEGRVRYITETLGVEARHAEGPVDLGLWQETYNYTYNGSTINYTAHVLFSAGETNGVLGKLEYSSGQENAQRLEQGPYGTHNYGSGYAPTFLEVTGAESSIEALPGGGSWQGVRLSGGAVSLGAGAIKNMGKPIQVNRDIYIPAADKVYEYRQSEFVSYYTFPTVLQKFQNKAAAINASNKGSMEVFPVLKIVVAAGQELTNPYIINQTTEEALSFSGTFKENETIEVDMLRRTVTSKGKNVFSLINLSSTSWWALQPGVNELLLGAERITGAPVLTAAWRHAWI